MPERKNQPLAPLRVFLRRLARNFLVSTAIVLVSLTMGTAGYCYFGNLRPIDGLLNASMILTGMGPVDKMDTDGGNVVALTDDPGGESDPSITADGRWIVFQYTDLSNVETIKRVSIDGGPILPVSTKEAINPAVSPDGKFVICKYEFRRPDAVQVAIVPVEDGEPVRVFNSPAMARSRSIRFSPDGRSLIYAEGRDKVDNLWSQPIEGGAPTQLTDFAEDRIFRFDISYPSGKFVFSRGTDTSDVVLIRNFR